MAKSCSRCARNSTKVSESTRPVSIKSVSSDGTCTFSLSENSAAMRCSSFVESGMSHGLVLGGQQIVEQAIEPAAVDAVALALPPDVPEVEALEHALRRPVRLQGPGVDGLKAQLGEAQREDLVARFGRGTAVALVAQHRPQRSGLELPIHVGQAHHADGKVSVISRVGPDDLDLPLRHDLQRHRRQRLDAVAEVQPLVVLRLAEPVRRQLDQLRAIQRQQFHDSQTPPAADGGDRKSTRLNSSHRTISYAVFCLKKKTTASRTVSF